MIIPVAAPAVVITIIAAVVAVRNIAKPGTVVDGILAVVAVVAIAIVAVAVTAVIVLVIRILMVMQIMCSRSHGLRKK